MSETNYTYSISGDFPNQAVDSSRLAREIQESNITIVIKDITTAGDNCNLLFKDELLSGNLAILNAIIASHSGQALIPDYTTVKMVDRIINDLGVPLMQMEFPRGEEVMVITHNLADKCSWFQESIRIDEEILPETDGYNWQTDHTYLIDMLSGRMFADFKYRTAVEHEYKVNVWVNDILKEERDPLESSGGDYKVYYEDGYILSFNNWSGSVVKCSYSYADGSTFTIRPDEGYEFSLEDADVQFSACIDYTDTICFEVWVYNPEDLPNKVLYDVSKYRSIKEIIEEARASSVGIVPAIGAGNIRGTGSSTIEIPFTYRRSRSLKSSEGTEIRVRLEHNREFGGRLASLSVYGSKILE